MENQTEQSIRMIETSVRAIFPTDFGGVLSLSGLPGLSIARDGATYLDPEMCKLTFDFLRDANVRSLYLLMEDDELPPMTKEVVLKTAKGVGIDLHWLPIVDFCTPESDIETAWKNLRDERMALLKDGHGICLACLYGAGRSGMMTAAVFVENGVEPKKAVAAVRKKFTEAVGSRAQELWVARATYLD